MILTEPDQQRISKSTLTDLPQGTRIVFEDDALLVKIGGKNAQVGKLSKKCFEGYLPNALHHVRQKHKKLLNSKKVNHRLGRFLKTKD